LRHEKAPFDDPDLITRRAAESTELTMSDKFVRLADKFWVSSQIGAKDIEDARALGIKLVVSNRPDREDSLQPDAAEIAAAAKDLGVDFAEVPVANVAAITDADIAAFARAIADARGGVLAYCRSGTRSTALRALARARAGEDPDAIIAEASEAGYDLRGLRPRLAALAIKAK
jgi:uncharacterized protein (TIGR01244 family)